MTIRKKHSHRRLFMAIAIVCLLLLVGGGYLVYAAMTATDRLENDFRIGQVETELVEENFIEPTEITANQTVDKKVTIKNNGTINQFVRVMVLPEVRAAVAGDPSNKQVLPLVQGTDLELEGLDTDKWKDGGDGYYYYVKEAVQPGKSTDSLFDSIKLSNSLSSQYNGAEFSLSLKVETINCNDTAYRQAWWHGETPTEQPLSDIDAALITKIDQ